MPESETESKSGRHRANCPKCDREVTFRKDGNPLPHNSPSGKDGASQRCPGSAAATVPILRPRRKDERKNYFIEDPSGLGGGLVVRRMRRRHSQAGAGSRARQHPREAVRMRGLRRPGLGVERCAEGGVT